MLVPSLVVIIGGCGAVDGSPHNAVPAVDETAQEIRQQDDDGRYLPFKTVHPHRWSRANSGTTYEPCTALGIAELSGLDIDAKSVEDAAATDGQTLRGCTWTYATKEEFTQWRISQIVGNSPSLAFEKALKSGVDDNWLEDRKLARRDVGVHYVDGLKNCDTYVQSGRAAVTTLVGYYGIDPVPPSEICDRALVFTAATISKMPL